jgi:hypothetical protein
MNRITRFVLAPLLILGGLWFIALPFGFVSMAFGGRETPPTWGEYLAEVWRGGVTSISWGLILVVGGLLLAAPDQRPPHPGKENKPMP